MRFDKRRLCNKTKPSFIALHAAASTGRKYEILHMKCIRKLFVCLPVLWLFACSNKQVLFEKISSSRSGITFNNQVIENDSINPIDLVNIYNGGGVGIGDFNKDGLPDIYFTGNMVANRLYLNKGDFHFEDITAAAGVDGMGRWARGVAIVDINNDSLPDIYVCNTIYKDSLRRRNLLYINMGAGKDGVPHFKEMAHAYGLDVHLESTMAAFFDYDNDGDLDMYLTVNEASYINNPNRFGGGSKNFDNRSRGRLYRNDMDLPDQHPVFHDVSEEAGITLEGYGHGATIADINRDGWKDIYVTNDFLSNNILYINNHDGTFTNESKTYFKHTSYNAMGQDIADINNDGLADVVELDMSPQDNYRKKMMLNASNYNTYQNFDLFNVQYQYVRNTLQLNQGPRVGENDSVGIPAFSEISFMSGMAQTDWSWAPLVTDFNNDGYRDIIITNGFPKDVSDHDFISYREEAVAVTPKREVIKQIPQIKLHNYAYLNKGDLTFTDATKAWGLEEPSFSNGAAYADLDNNGTMDIVVNNINDEAFIYKNTSAGLPDAGHYLQIRFKGGRMNTDGIGAWADIYYDNGKHQVYENNPYRGYLSTMQPVAGFGTGSITLVDSVVIRWPGGLKQKLQQVKTDQVLVVNIKDAAEKYTWDVPLHDDASLFKEITSKAGIHYKNQNVDFIDFNLQTTLPHKLSEYNPAIAAGDMDGNGFDDMIVGNSSASATQLLLQQPDGTFLQRDLYKDSSQTNRDYKDAGILIFDANGDGSPDVYITSGGYRYASQDPNYQDRLYLNNGKGIFTLATDALPLNHTSKLCARSIDYNGDGKPDLFVSGRVDPWNYPKPVSSFIFRNDSDKGHARFTDVTAEVAPGLQNIGLVCDAICSDFDNDLSPDLILAGEWMPVTFLKNVHGKFVNVTAASGLTNTAGWWNSMVAGDFRHTGRTDYIAGNVGLNTLYQASDRYPVFMTAKDFDGNGSYVPIPSLFLPDQDGSLKEFPANGRDEIIERIPTMKKRFDHYKAFAGSAMDEILTPAQRNGALRLKATMLRSCYIRNDGNGKFTMIPLPKEAQMSALNGMTTGDFDGDGNLDVLINGNDYGTEVSVGRYDALNGLLLLGDGKGNFKPLSILQSGIYIPGNGKGLVKLRGSSGSCLVAASQHQAALKLFELKRKVTAIGVNPDDVSAVIRFKNGQIQKEELYSGTSFLSQSARFINADTNMLGITFFTSKGRSRAVDLTRAKLPL